MPVDRERWVCCRGPDAKPESIVVAIEWLTKSADSSLDVMTTNTISTTTNVNINIKQEASLLQPPVDHLYIHFAFMFEMSVPITGKSGNEERATALENEFEKRPDPVALTQNPDPSKNSSSGVDYEPYPEQSIKLEPEREKIVQSICNLYSGSASKEDMMVYAEEAIYDDPWSYCDTRYKIAGQWYGMCLPNCESRLPTPLQGFSAKSQHC